ncbi:MAG TPA: hypothetical protein VLT33_14475 [Labilithrix sp.]|nr:hypothetical protein [Labilithrix sp.]
MRPRQRPSRALFAAAVFVVAGAGCSLLVVSGDVPEFQCSPGATGTCPSDQECDPSSKRCVALDGGSPVPEASDEDVVTDDVRDGGSDGDATTAPGDLGAKCRLDVECKSKLCASGTILTTTITSATGPICTSPCCTSTECPATFVCFNGGTGGGYCVPKALAQRTPPAVGGFLGGTNCVSNTDCRSGLCAGTPKTCVDTCCAAGDCGGTSTCRLKATSAPGPTHDIWVCAMPEPGATKLPGDNCTDSSECASDNCIGIAAGRICRPPCSNTASCRTVSGFAAGHCLYGSSGNDYFKFCFSGTTSSDSDAGVSCTDDTTCKSDFCDAELKACANVCGKDSDCAPNEACRPSGVNTPYLRCVPRP